MNLCKGLHKYLGSSLSDYQKLLNFQFEVELLYNPPKIAWLSMIFLTGILIGLAPVHKMKTTLVITLVVIEIVSCLEVVHAQVSPGRHNEQVQQENRATACKEDNSFLSLTRLGCLFLRTFSPPPSSGGVTSLNKPSSNFSPPSDSGGQRTPARPPVTDAPKERSTTGARSPSRNRSGSNPRPQPSRSHPQLPQPNDPTQPVSAPATAPLPTMRQ